MAVTFVAASTLGSVAVNPPTVNLTLPALEVNDIIVIHIMSKNISLTGPGQANEINVPSGYTETGTRLTINAAANADDMHTAMFWKRAVAGDSGASVTCSRGGTSTLNLAAIATVWRGAVKSGDPFDTTGIVTNGDITVDNDVDFAAFDPTATDVHVIYLGWHADDGTTAANFTNDGTTFTVRNDQESSVGSDLSVFTWSADRNGNALAAVAPSIGGTAGSSIGYTYALLPGGGGTASDDVLVRFGSLDATTGSGLVTTSFAATGGAAAVVGGMMMFHYVDVVQGAT